MLKKLFSDLKNDPPDMTPSITFKQDLAAASLKPPNPPFLAPNAHPHTSASLWKRVLDFHPFGTFGLFK